MDPEQLLEALRSEVVGGANIFAENLVWIGGRVLDDGDVVVVYREHPEAPVVGRRELLPPGVTVGWLGVDPAD